MSVRSEIRTEFDAGVCYAVAMSSYGQFCSVARAHDAIGGRWTLLVVRELLSGSQRFNDIRRGIPRISRTMLSERLQALISVGAVTRIEGAKGPEYVLSPAGDELAGVIGALATWGQRWLPRRAHEEDLEFDPLLVDMQRRVRRDRLQKEPFVVRFDLDGCGARFLLLKPGEVSACAHNPGFPELLHVCGRLSALVAWWRGDANLAEAQRMGLILEGQRPRIRAFPTWFERYQFAHVTPAPGVEA